jgi:hypothetical protein
MHVHLPEACVVEGPDGVLQHQGERVASAAQGPLELGPIPVAEPDLPPRHHLWSREVLGSAGPQRLYGRQADLIDPLDEVRVAGRAARGALPGVLLETAHEIAQGPVGHEHRRALDYLLPDQDALHSNELGPVFPTPRVEHAVSQVIAREAVEHDVHPG